MVGEKVSEIVKQIVEENVQKISFLDSVVSVQYLVDFDIARLIVKNIADKCFDEDGNYHPEIREFLERIAIISAYTDIELPESVAEQYAFLYGTDIYQNVIGAVSEEQVCSILGAVEEKVQWRIKTSSDAIMSNILEVYAKLDAMTNDFGKVYSDISNADMSAFIKAVSNGKLDEKKLVEAIVDSKE